MDIPDDILNPDSSVTTPSSPFLISEDDGIPSINSPLHCISLHTSSDLYSSSRSMDIDHRLQRFSPPKAEGDCNVSPGRGLISLSGSSVNYCKNSACAAQDISADEEDLINRLHKLLGDRWALIAGRFPWRGAEEIENYCKMRYTATISSSRS